MGYKSSDHHIRQAQCHFADEDIFGARSYTGRATPSACPLTGKPKAQPNAFAAATPTRVPVNEPGPTFTVIARNSDNEWSFSANSRSIIGNRCWA